MRFLELTWTLQRGWYGCWLGLLDGGVGGVGAGVVLGGEQINLALGFSLAVQFGCTRCSKIIGIRNAIQSSGN